MIVYLAWGGEYTDKYVAGAFSERDDAVRLADELGGWVSEEVLDLLVPAPGTPILVALDEHGADATGAYLATTVPSTNDPKPEWWTWSVMPVDNPSPENSMDTHHRHFAPGASVLPVFVGAVRARDASHAAAIARMNQQASIAAGDLDAWRAELAAELDRRAAKPRAQREHDARFLPVVDQLATHRACFSHQDCREHTELSLACAKSLSSRSG